MLDISTFRVAQGANLKLSHASTDDSGKYKSEEEVSINMQDNISEMIKLQNKLYAEDSYALLIIFQAMDAAGKDACRSGVCGHGGRGHASLSRTGATG